MKRRGLQLAGAVDLPVALELLADKEGVVCREGATAIVVCQQPTTDICSFFTRAFVLCTGEVVYFGETGAQAMQLLASSGMPCPPLYSPLEQFMRLVDPSFEVRQPASGLTRMACPGC